MRDPTRIARITAKLAAVWERAPDLRLGQLCDIIAYTGFSGRQFDFNTEDEAFEAALDAYATKPYSYFPAPETLP